MNVSLTPLHVRSGYSLLCGTALPERLIARAAALGYAGLALTDVNNLCAATTFYRQAREARIAPIVGAELQDDGRAVVVLVEDGVGYENLCRIVTRIHRRASSGRDDDPGPTMSARCRSRLADESCSVDGSRLTGDVAELGGRLHVIVEDAALARRLLAAGAAGDRLWLGVDPPTQSRAQLRGLTALAGRSRLRLVATGKALYAEPGDRDVARLLAAIRLGTTYEALPDAALPPTGAHLRDPAAWRTQLAAFPDAIRNNARLAERCRYALLPREPVFPAFPCPDGVSAARHLRQLCRQGLKRRYGRTPPPAAEGRLARELALIERMGFSGYFLVVWDIVQYARRRGAAVAGRGSGAGSLVAYVLGVTNVCPLAFGLPFERFAHEGREDFPDLDVDFCWRVRDEAIDYAFGRWGPDRVAMVCTHNTFQAASALRETAKAFGLSDAQVSRLARDGRAAAPDPRDLPDGAPRRILTLAERIRGLPRLLSVHPGGIVIAPEPIDRYVPVQQAAKRLGAGPSGDGPGRGVTITQFDKHGVEDIGLVKIDLLGNRNLSTIRAACDLIARGGGRAIEVESLPPSDPATVRCLRAADTVGCNQLESPAMRHLLRMLAPAGVRDVMKALALIRPGAASIGMKETFVRRHRGLEPVPGGHRQTDAILEDTYGVMLYEDDVMQVAAALIGGTLPAGDRFRRAIQKCRTDDDRRRLSREFLARCRANGVDADLAADAWVQMAKFNAYSFCRAHAASYAVLAYAGAYLKTHHPPAFWTAALNNNQSMYHPRVYVEQARRAGVRFRLPDVNRSGEEFTIDGGAIRVGLARVAGLGPAAVAAILDARRDGPFESLSDCLARTHLGREEARALVLCGAFDGFARPRPRLMLELDLFAAGRTQCPSGPALLPANPIVPDAAPDYSPARKYADERRILGLSVGGHVMAWYRPHLNGSAETDSRQLPDRVGRRVRVAGVLEAVRTTPTRTGRTVTFLTLDDEYGLFEVTVFPDRARRTPNFSRYGPYVVAGRVENQYDVVSISAETISWCRIDPFEAAE